MAGGIYGNLREFIREKFVEILREEGNEARIGPLIENLVTRLRAIDWSLGEIPRHVVMDWALSDRRVGIRSDGRVVLVVAGRELTVAEGRVLALIGELGAVTIADVAEALGVPPRTAARLLRDMTKRGVIKAAKVHDVRSKIPRRILVYGRSGGGRGGVVHEYARRIVKELMPAERFREEVGLGNSSPVDLVSERWAVEVVASRMGEEGILALRERLMSAGDRNRLVVVYRPSARETRLLAGRLRAALGDVSPVVTLFELARMAKK
ncbi:MAG: helix-turn-helix domain-containing protein [Candidatus Korarchaeota archaeon]|nr:helix-turn-helix domain-containing protein [Candidatus Korarchaeota archaeon]